MQIQVRLWSSSEEDSKCCKVWSFCCCTRWLPFISAYSSASMSCPTQKRRPASGRLSWGICCHRQLMVITDTPVLWPHRPAARLWNGSSSPGPCICPTHRCVKSEHTHTPRQLYFPCTVRSHLHAVSGSVAVPWCQHTSRFFPHLLLHSSSSCFPPQPLCLLNQNCLHIVHY